MQKQIKFLVLIMFLSATTLVSFSQKKKKDSEKKDKGIESVIGGLKFRSIGPAFSSGRIADFAVNPDNTAQFYVAAACGHVWKTENNGISFSPVFDNYGAYSIGCITMDPNNHNVLWIGTGEHNHQRAIGYGNGVYKSLDGGKSWKNMGLKDSRQIGGINIDPRNSNIVLVAAEGSIWGPGGDRGLYRTTDGGKTWKKVIEISENTGINNIVRDPSDPNIMYASSEERRRHVFTKIGGGPETKIYKSEDGGKTWRKIMKGLPSVDMGGTGIAISPVNPGVVYIIVEAADGKGGFFRSTDKGESWSKMSNHTSSGQYDNEIYCDPKDVDKVYSVETVSKYTEDGGKTWKNLGLKNRHVDDHALWLDPKNPDHFLIGGDGGVYISYDAGKTFRHVSNLPVTQFYRVYLDNAEPFYNVYGGTQDNNSYGGPSRSICSKGVSKADWLVTIGGDGFWGAVDPENSDIVYSEYQYGNLYRYDKKSGQNLLIKPAPGKNELTYRWNWSSPFIISPHNHNRLYLAANKLFRSNDQGNSWETISPDLTAQIDRNTWKVMGKYWSVDAVKKDVSTSLYGTIVSLDESPVKEGLIYVGTDDGVIQVTDDGGKNWRKINKFPDVPEYTYVSDIFADEFDADVVYASFDNRKRDDFKPYLLKSSDKGNTWVSISNNLPKNGTVQTVAQDFKNKNLLFAGTEFGFFFSLDGGKKWTQIKSGIPDVAVRDIAIQKRENDIVLATFGRGFYILDNYDPLRHISESFIKDKKAFMFPVKDALQYIQTDSKYGQGETDYFAKNPPYGAIFTYYLKEVPLSTKEARRKKEKELFKKAEKIPQPSWKEQEDENREEPSYLLFTIKDSEGNVVKKLTAKPAKGINRISWNLAYDNPYPVKEDLKKFNPFKKNNAGMPVLPGTYKVTMGISDKGVYKKLCDPIAFKVVKLNNSTLPASDENALAAYLKDLTNTVRVMNGTVKFVENLQKKIVLMKQTALEASGVSPETMQTIQNAEKTANDLMFVLEGVSPKASYEEIPPHKLPLEIRLQDLAWAHISSTSAVTETERSQLTIVKDELPAVIAEIKKLATQTIPEIEKTLNNAGAPWTPGRIIKE
ncbi:MAG: glycosyl hydrolase [Chlorobi bacterium]|nr:glycosyl hydrolase [Chlorobiota bacterium]